MCGLEQLELLLKQFPDVPTLAHLELVDSPLIVSPDELAEIVYAFAEHTATITDALDMPPTDRVSYDAKNAVNNMTKEYAVAQRKYYLKETAQIQKFLAAQLRCSSSIRDIGLDVGTSKAAASLAKCWTAAGSTWLGWAWRIARHPRGVVVNLEAAVDSIKKAVEEAELMAGMEIDSVHLALSGRTSRGSTAAA